MKSCKKLWDFRDVSVGLRMLREFLLGRKHELEDLHGRFGPRLAPRSIPRPDIPRGPVYKYSDQYYANRNAMDSVKMPVIAPFGECAPCEKPACPLSFKRGPTPGNSWWWDGHFYYDFILPPPPPVKPIPPCPPPWYARKPDKPDKPAPYQPKQLSKCEKTCRK